MELVVISSLVLPLLGPRLQHFLSAAGMPGLFIEGCNTCFLGLLWGPRGFFAQLLPQSSGPQGSASGRPVLLGRAQGSVAPSFQAPAWLPRLSPSFWDLVML